VAHDFEGADPGQQDQKADAKGILIVFCALVLAAIYFVSGWVPGT